MVDLTPSFTLTSSYYLLSSVIGWRASFAVNQSLPKTDLSTVRRLLQFAPYTRFLYRSSHAGSGIHDTNPPCLWLSVQRTHS
jgi:hypothetical protein